MIIVKLPWTIKSPHRQVVGAKRGTVLRYNCNHNWSVFQTHIYTPT